MLFWDVVPSAVVRAKAAGCLLLHQVRSLKAALAAEAAGADVLIVQGVEAGGHVHGTASALLLVEQLVRAVKLYPSSLRAALRRVPGWLPLWHLVR